MWVCMYIYVCMYVCMCACVCIERERERECVHECMYVLRWRLQNSFFQISIRLLSRTYKAKQIHDIRDGLICRKRPAPSEHVN